MKDRTLLENTFKKEKGKSYKKRRSQFVIHLKESLVMKAVFCAILWLVVRADSQCRYVTIEGAKKGDTGNPGKAGPKGNPGANGVKGSSGERGSKGDSANLEEFKIEMRRRFEELENRFQPVSCETSPTNGSQTLRNGNVVFCDRGWTVFQRRFDGSVSFDRNWEEYKNGFGSTTGEFWLGLEQVHQQTKLRGCRLRIDLGSFDDDSAYAEYSDFSLGSEEDRYRLRLQGYSGTAGDSMTGSSSNNNMYFTTKDRDNDAHSGGNCAVSYGGGWWYRNCSDPYLNSPWLQTTQFRKGITWYHWKGWSEGLKTTTMRFRCD